MAKYASLFPGSLDRLQDHGMGQGIGLDIDRGPEDVFGSDDWDLMEDAILAIERYLIAGAGVSAIWDADADTGIQTDAGGIDEDFIRFDTFGTERMIIRKDGKIGIGTTAVPHAGIGYAMLAIDAANAVAAGPHIQITTATNEHPLLQILNWEHDDIAIYFDSYYDGGEVSSDVGSNFRITKGRDVNDQFKIEYDEGIAAGGAVTWEDGIVLDAFGRVTKPNNVAFLVKPTASQTNIAINAGVTVVWGSERFDIGGNFAANTFTAPVTGKYHFDVYLRLNEVDQGADHYQIRIITTARTYIWSIGTDQWDADPEFFPVMLSVLADMTAGHTAHVTVFQAAGGVQTDIHTDSWFSGWLVQ